MQIFFISCQAKILLYNALSLTTGQEVSGIRAVLQLFKKSTIKQFVWALVLGGFGEETISASDLCRFICIQLFLLLSRVLSDCPGYWIKAPSC